MPKYRHFFPPKERETNEDGRQAGELEGKKKKNRVEKVENFFERARKEKDEDAIGGGKGVKRTAKKCVPDRRLDCC